MRRMLAAGGLAAAVALLAPCLTPALSSHGALEAIVKDERGKPVADAVVSLSAPGGPPGGAPAAPRAAAAVMDQQNKEFVPLVLPVAVGTPVTFPNRDNIRHHVYSFSTPKKFELPLYIGTPAAPVVFDKPGAVVLGCNIHDWMVGYVYVLPTPWFGKTGEDGKVRIGEVPAGAYEARVWHPRARTEPEKTTTPVTLAAGEPGQLAFTVPLKPDRRPIKRPGYEGAQGS
jgi:plastocyanin